MLEVQFIVEFYGRGHETGVEFEEFCVKQFGEVQRQVVTLLHTALDGLTQNSDVRHVRYILLYLLRLSRCANVN